MKNKHSSIDGFVPRRPGDQLGGLHRSDIQKTLNDIPDKLLHTTGGDAVRNLGEQQLGYGLGRTDIDDSLRDIEETEEPVKKLSRRQRRRLSKQFKRPKSLKSRIFKWFFVLIFIAILAGGGYFAYKFINAGGNMFQGNIFEIFQNQPLKMDSNGRSNFLILGTSEDDPGHQGANLTDSILVLSVDQNNKNAYMFSVPRDLEVQYNMPCVPGYSGKINAFFSCANIDETKEAEQDRLTKTQELVGDIFGIDIQYGIHVNYTVMRDVVNAIGGSITVTIESRDSRGQMDANFDWKCGASYYTRIKNCPPSGHYIDYPNGPVTLDAEHTLYLAQARGDILNYGFEQSNFDREKNQQKILVAIRDKAMSTGVLTNLGAVTKLIDALGNNLRTNIQTNEIRTLMQVASEIKSGDINSISLIDGDSPVMDGSGNPSAGKYNYTDIRAFIKQNLSNDPIIHEAAPIAVFNGTGQDGFGQTKADTLTTAGYNVTYVGTAPSGEYDEVSIYQIGTGNSGTARTLATLYNVKIQKTTPPITVYGDIKFIIIFGPVVSI